MTDGWSRTRTLALTVACPFCHAAIGDPCVVPDWENGGMVPLTWLPAHDQRIARAKAVTQ